MLESTLQELRAEFTGRAEIVAVDVMKNEKLVEQYGILGTPTLLLFHQGNLKGEFMGPQQKVDLSARLQELLVT